MANRADLEKLTGLARAFGAFVAERHPLALADAIDAFEQAAGARALRDARSAAERMWRGLDPASLRTR